MEYDAELLERVGQKFRQEMWESVVEDAVEDGVEVEVFDPVLATTFAELGEFHHLNQILGAAEPGAIDGGHLAAAIEWMRLREVDYCVPIAEGRPGTAAAEAWLGARGYERAGGWIRFVRDASPPPGRPSPNITIWPLGEQDFDGEGMSEIAAEAMDLPVTVAALFFGLPGRPHWHCYTASVNEEWGIVSTASMLIHEGVAQLGPGNTLPQSRGRGCATELLRQRLEDAHLAGCHTVSVEIWDSEPGRPSPAARIFERAGFEPAYAVSDWRRPALHPATTEPQGFP